MSIPRPKQTIWQWTYHLNICCNNNPLPHMKLRVPQLSTGLPDGDNHVLPPVLRVQKVGQSAMQTITEVTDVSRGSYWVIHSATTSLTQSDFVFLNRHDAQHTALLWVWMILQWVIHVSRTTSGSFAHSVATCVFPILSNFLKRNTKSPPSMRKHKQWW